MGVKPRQRVFYRRIWRQKGLRVLWMLLFLVSFLEVLQLHSNLIQGETEARLHRNQLERRQERIYIAGLYWMNGKILKEHWNDAVVRLTETFGAANVYVNVFESGSWDDTKEALQALDAELARRNVERRIEMSDVTHQDEIDNAIAEGNWVAGSQGEKHVRRIPYMARLRNHVLEDLMAMNERGVHFDKVLFLGDVVFSTEDVLNLLDTNGGDYAAACSLDFKDAPKYYDTFALRDTKGLPATTEVWPYFGPGTSRQAIMSNADAVPVRSCWNGIVAMDAEPFVSQFTRLRFRAASDSLAAYHLEGSECCLVHADNPLSASRGVFINPRVRVAYDAAAYEAVHPEDGSPWVSLWGIFWGTWLNRILGWVSPVERWLTQSWVKGVLDLWEKEDALNYEPGDFCLINEMQVLVHNGWVHV